MAPLYIAYKNVKTGKNIMHPWFIQTSRSISHLQDESYLHIVLYTSKECITWEISMTNSLKEKYIYLYIYCIKNNRVAMFPKGDPDLPLTEE